MNLYPIIMVRPELGTGYYVCESELGRNLAGPFVTQSEAELWRNNNYPMQPHQTPPEPTLDPLVKLIRSMKIIRAEAIAETPEAKQELVDAALDVAATFIIGIYQQGQHLERISHAIIAQTHLLAAVYSSADSPEETARRVAAAKDEMDANLAKMG